MEAEADEFPEVVYHYCGASAFLSILKTRQLWMGRLSSLNDYTEFTWIRNLALEEAARRRSNLEAYTPKIRRLFSLLSDELHKPVHSDPHVACFSGDGDVLSQWRAYADEGQGFAIGFDSNSLHYSSELGLRAVEYDESEHRVMVDEFFDEFLKAAERSSDRIENKMVAALCRSLINFGIYFKNPKFEEEFEFRVVQDQSPDDAYADMPSVICRQRAFEEDLESFFRTRGPHIVEHLLMPFNDQFNERAVKKIMLGPRNPARNERRPLLALLRQSGYLHLTEHDVQDSAATLR